MTKQELIERMESMISSWNIESCGVKTDKYLIPEEWAQLPMAMVRQAYKWIKATHENEAAEVRKIYTLTTPARWESYELYDGLEHYPEGRLLITARVNLRKHLNNITRPDIFKKGKVKRVLIERRKASAAKST